MDLLKESEVVYKKRPAFKSMEIIKYSLARSSHVSMRYCSQNLDALNQRSLHAMQATILASFPTNKEETAEKISADKEVN